MKNLKKRFWRLLQNKIPKKLSGNLELIIIFLIVIVFFYPVFILKKIPIPLDALVGAYYPWLDYKWGYIVGVPFKNISLSDVFSQLYPWRVLAMEALRNGHWPLWNPYSFSGTPLLANWQSAPFYPLNILLLVFGDVWGWSLMVIFQPLLSLIFMYFYLKKIGIGKFGCLIGAITFSFSGFMITYLEYATIGQIMIWLPLQLLLIEEYIDKKRVQYLALYALSFFPVLTAGFFQPALYVLGVSVSYLFIRLKLSKNQFFKVLVFILLGIGSTAIQLIPTFELFGYSIRSLDHNILVYKYGLLPIRNLLTFFAPDFFGNPSTNNFWGFLQYQETSGYYGVVTLVLVIVGFLGRHKTFYFKFFSTVFSLSLIFAFDNPLSRLIYQFNVPLLSGGYASRLLMLTSFGASVLAAIATDNISIQRVKKITGLLLIILVMIISVVFYGIRVNSSLINTAVFGAQDIINMRVALRNLLIPIGLLTTLFLVSVFFRKYKNFVKNTNLYNYLSSKKAFQIFVFLLITIDLFRFSYKFLPFSNPNMANLSTEITNYLKSNTGYFRVEREWGPILPPNTWIYSRLSTPSGYDPLIIRKYANWFELCQSSARSNFTENKLTRYLEVNKYDSPCVDISGVKYLTAIKRNKSGDYDKDGMFFNDLIPTNKYEMVYSSGTVSVLENKNVLPRVLLYENYFYEPNDFLAQEKAIWDIDLRKDIVINTKPKYSNHSVSETDTVRILEYSPNKVVIETNTSSPAFLLLSDTYYPGWNSYIDGELSQILVGNGVYRSSEIPGGKHEVVFKFEPDSFRLGLSTSIVSILALILILIYSLYRSKGKHY